MLFRLLSDTPVSPAQEPRICAIEPGVWGAVSGLSVARAEPAGRVIPMGRGCATRVEPS